MIWARTKKITLEFADKSTCDVEVKVPTFEDFQDIIENKLSKLDTFKKLVLSVDGLSAEELKDIEHVPGAAVIVPPVSDYIISLMSMGPKLKNV